MLKTTKDIRIFGAIMIAVLFMFIAAGYLDGEHFDAENYLVVGVYFLNPATSKLEPELRTISRGTNEGMANELLDILIEGPRNNSLVKTIPDFVKLHDGQLIENLYRLKLEFMTDGEVMTTEEELFFKSSLCWTMTELKEQPERPELPIIKDVHIYINEREMLNADGSPVGLLNRDNIIVNKIISPFRSEMYRALLYFADSGYTRLVPEERLILVSTDIAWHVVEQIIAGTSRPEHFATVPPETSIREVTTDGDICYVNLSADVFSRAMAPNGDMLLTIYSVVNSLTELDGIRRVQFLIDSRTPVDIVEGGHDLSVPIERDEALIFIADKQ